MWIDDEGKAHCNWEHEPEEPCWGKVLWLMDLGEHGDMHACEGHNDAWEGKYHPNPDAKPE